VPHRAGGRALACGLLCLTLLGARAYASAPEVPDAEAFSAWLGGLRAEARARGIGDTVLASALDGLRPLPIVVTRDRTQAEVKLDLDLYLRRRLTRDAERHGRRALASHRRLLDRVEEAFGVDPATLISVWGLESNFGRFVGVRPTVAALATLAFDPRRSGFFREELLLALEILHRGDIELPKMKGSWAGAMGQPQFLPSSYVKHAVDFDADGRKDIWSSLDDELASIAHYLTAHGWTRGERWGRRVSLSRASREGIAAAAPPRAEGCAARRALSQPLALARWHELGVRLPSGGRLPAADLSASLLEIDGRAYLVYRNYEAVLGYNCANTYALSVVLLADRIAGR
jgi:membrane-bound lytic murein transglycosylase B